MIGFNPFLIAELKALGGRELFFPQSRKHERGNALPSGSSKRVSSRTRWNVGSFVPQISLSSMMTCESRVSHSPGPS